MKIGNTVTRNFCGRRMELIITDITDDIIECGPWTFCKKTGMEIDDCLDWGPEFGKSGSYLEEIWNKNYSTI